MKDTVIKVTTLSETNKMTDNPIAQEIGRLVPKFGSMVQDLVNHLVDGEHASRGAVNAMIAVLGAELARNVCIYAACAHLDEKERKAMLEGALTSVRMNFDNQWEDVRADVLRQNTKGGIN